jgi:hypothetical protein
VFGIDTHIDVIEHHGGTDPLIAVKVMMHHGIKKEQVGACVRVLRARVYGAWVLFAWCADGVRLSS